MNGAQQPQLNFLFYAFLLITAMGSTSLFAAEVSVAVTSNFDFTLDELKQEFEALSGHKVIAVPGPSAQHYGEILEGAAYDIFLSEDEMRPEALEKQGRIIPDSRFTYAHARLVLWSIDNRKLTAETLSLGEFEFLAIANPRLSPYGNAAREILEAMGSWDNLQEKLVIGENIGQTYHFGISGEVDMALIAFSQIIFGKFLQAGSYWLIPENLYTPIKLQGVRLSNNKAAKEFINFMKSPRGKSIIQSNGFSVP